MNIQISYKELIELSDVINTHIENATGKISNVAFDSRISPHPIDSLFIAIKGEQFDAHDFINEALAEGFRSFVVSNEVNFLQLKKNNVDVILVRNTLRFTQELAHYQRGKFSFPVIAITGSNGKTVCKEWIYELLKNDYRILRSPKSYNSQIGVALSLLELTEDYNLAIIEAGISEPNEMQYLQKIINPSFGLFTNNLDVHVENFESLELKNIEKHKLFSGLNSFVENKKYALSEHPGIWKDETVSISKCEGYSDITINEDAFRVAFTEDFLIENAINSFLVAKKFTKDKEQLLKNMNKLKPIAMRWEQFDGVNGNLLINDSYSLDLGSLKVALQQLSNFATIKKKVVVLAGLNISENEEVELNMVFKTFGVDSVLYLGEKRRFLEGKTFLTKEQLAAYIRENIIDSVLLFKASRNENISSLIRELKKKNHRTSLEIDLTKMKSNLMVYRSKLNNATKLLVMVKAASYGAGLKEVTSFLMENNVDYLGVAFTDEGIALRATGVNLPIMVMNPDETYFSKGVKANLEPVIHSLEHLDRIINVLIGENIKNYPIHIKFDTGMNRLGLSLDEIPFLIDTIKAQPEIKVKSILSHFSNADNQEMDRFTKEQFDKFQGIKDSLTSGLGYSFDAHICNSNASIRFPEYHLDMIRLGIGLHGSSVLESGLESSMTLKSYISQIRLVKANNLIGYGNKTKTNKDTLIGIVPIGYADGITRSFGRNGGYVSVLRKKCKVLGDVCMDMLMIDLSAFQAKDILEGTEVEFFGESITIEEHAKFQNTISYEVISRLSERVSRVYVRE